MAIRFHKEYILPPKPGNVLRSDSISCTPSHLFRFLRSSPSTQSDVPDSSPCVVHVTRCLTKPRKRIKARSDPPHRPSSDENGSVAIGDGAVSNLKRFIGVPFFIYLIFRDDVDQELKELLLVFLGEALDFRPHFHRLLHQSFVGIADHRLKWSRQR
uniref:Uncharacterized protein n=1 Tax=Steinernema glaseri TaxID=37863 RepID=A0A1I7Y0D5_9BILA